MVDSLEAARVEFDHQLLDVGQTSWIGEYSVERGPLSALDINLHKVNRRLRNINGTRSSLC